MSVSKSTKGMDGISMLFMKDLCDKSGSVVEGHLMMDEIKLNIVLCGIPCIMYVHVYMYRYYPWLAQVCFVPLFFAIKRGAKCVHICSTTPPETADATLRI